MSAGQNKNRKKFRQNGISYIELWEIVEEKNNLQLTEGRIWLIIKHDNMARSVSVWIWRAVGLTAKGVWSSLRVSANEALAKRFTPVLGRNGPPGASGSGRGEGRNASVRWAPELRELPPIARGSPSPDGMVTGGP